MELITERLRIRKLVLDDSTRAHSLFVDDEAMRFLALFPALSSVEESVERTKEWAEDNEHFAIAIKETDEFIGYVAINPDSEEEREDTREFGFGLTKEYRHQGYMSEALEAVLSFLKEKGIKYVWACYFEGNEDSKKLIGKLGFDLINIGEYDVEGDRVYTSYECRKTLK